jgi:hypothetical protein
LRVVLPVVDELNGDHFCCPDERTAGSFFGHDFDPIAQCRRASGPESPHPLIGVAATEQQIVLLSIRERDDHLHGPRRLRPERSQRFSGWSVHPPRPFRSSRLDASVSGAREIGQLRTCGPVDRYSSLDS